VRKRVSGQERSLKKEQADIPHGGRTADERQQLLADQRLEPEDQRRTAE
jgi:hypothetical protein